LFPSSGAATHSGLDASSSFPQGSSFLATLGFVPESLWDSAFLWTSADPCKEQAGTRRFGPSSGFSLVEVMCAILILGVGLFGLTEGITAALKSSKESEVQTAAALIAAGQIETLRAEGYVIDGDTDGDCEGGLARYRWRQSVKSTAIAGLHEVEVIVENSKSGKTIYELRTLLFDPPLNDLPSEGSRDKTDPTRSNRRERSGG